MRNRISEDISFRKLEILLAYMEGGNLNAAARMLDISAVSVHRALHSLEEAMSCQLFSLQGRNLIPNEAAQVLAEVSRDVLKLMADGIAATRSAAGYSADHLRIGSLYSLTTGLVPKGIIGIKLIGESTGQPIGALMAFVRQLAHFLDSLLCYIGYLWPLWDDKRQTFADKILSTVVVRQPKS